MSRITRWAFRSTYALFVAAALTFGATQAFATTTFDDCPSGEEFIGTCPPWDDVECNQECLIAFFHGGACLGHCCVCYM